MIKKIIPRIVAIIVLLVGFNFVYQKYFYKKDLIKNSDIIENLWKIQDSCEVIYFGESSNFTTSPRDFNKNRISEFIAEYFPNKKFGHVDKGALHAEIYLNLLKNIPKNSPVETVIITLNLRSFNADWRYSKLETALQKSLVLLKPYPPLANRFLLSFKAYDIKSDKERHKQVHKEWKKHNLNFPFPFEYRSVKEWDKACFHEGIKNPDGSKNYKLTELACHYIKTYAFQIDPNKNPRIKDYDEIVEYCKERGWNLVFNLLAENIYKADELVGQELIYLMKYNRDLLRNRYTEQGAIVVDNFDKVPDIEYIDKDWTTEHYAENGRKIIAENVAEAMKILYKDDYMEVAYDELAIQNLDSVYFNDMESEKNWGQKQTLTQQQAYSGNTSSLTNKSNQYSVTLEQPLKSIPVKLLKKIEISAQLFAEGYNDDTQFVIEIIKGGQNVYWKGFKLNSLGLKNNKWQEVTINDYVPDVAYHSDIVKVYLWNPSSSNVYLDDFKIEFKGE